MAVTAAKDMLPSYVEQMDLPGFGLLDRAPQQQQQGSYLRPTAELQGGLLDHLEMRITV